MGEQGRNPKDNTPLLSPEADLFLYNEFFAFSTERRTYEAYFGAIAMRLSETSSDNETESSIFMADLEFTNHLFTSLQAHIQEAPIRHAKLQPNSDDLKFLVQCELYAEVLSAGMLLPHEDLSDEMRVGNYNLIYCEALAEQVTLSLPELGLPTLPAVISRLRGGTSGILIL